MAEIPVIKRLVNKVARAEIEIILADTSSSSNGDTVDILTRDPDIIFAEGYDNGDLNVGATSHSVELQISGKTITLDEKDVVGGSSQAERTMFIAMKLLGPKENLGANDTINVSARAKIPAGHGEIEIVALDDFATGDTFTSQIQNPVYGFALLNYINNVGISSGVRPGVSISGRTVTISHAALGAGGEEEIFVVLVGDPTSETSTRSRLVFPMGTAKLEIIDSSATPNDADTFESNLVRPDATLSFLRVGGSGITFGDQSFVQRSNKTLTLKDPQATAQSPDGVTLLSVGF